MYLSLVLEMYNSMLIASLGFIVVDEIKKHLLGLTQSGHLGHHFSPHPLGSVETEGCIEYF